MPQVQFSPRSDGDDNDEAGTLMQDILRRLKHEIYPDILRVLQLREQKLR